MDNEELAVWKKLSECECVKKVFGARLSDWIVGDRIIFGNTTGTVTQTKTVPRYGDYIYCRFDEDEGFLSRDTLQFANENFIRLVPLYDRIRPERSLIGIAKKLANDPSIPAYKQAELEQNLDYCIQCDRPDLALARAIIEQEKGEGDGTEV